MYSVNDERFLSILEGTHIEVVNVCCECGESYGDITIVPVTEFNKHLAQRDGHLKSHGYCSECYEMALEKLRLHPGR